MTDRDIFKNYDHFQIGVDIEIKLYGSLHDPITFKGYSNIAETKYYIKQTARRRADEIKEMIFNSFVTGKKRFQLDDYGIRYDVDMLKKAKITCTDCFVLARKFLEKYRKVVEFKQFTKQDFRDVYNDYKRKYGAGFKKKLAEKFDISPRSVENYLYRAPPKTKKFRFGVIKTVSDIATPEKYRFELNDDLTQSSYIGKNKLIRTQVLRAVKTPIGNMSWSFITQQFDLINKCYKTAAIRWAKNI